MKLLIKIIESKIVPDFLLRIIIKRLLRDRLKKENVHIKNHESKLKEFHANLKNYPIAIATDEANQQHYENPSELFTSFMGKHLKYSCCYWEDEDHDLSKAEESMLRLTVERARIKDGHTILDLGCGWGSLSIYLAKNFPNSKIFSVSNSKIQKQYIDSFNYKNLNVITKDINSFEIEQQFDRVISIEMFEHMRNWEKLLEKISRWINPSGLMLIHIFVHKNTSYLLDNSGKVNWMSENFFKEGMIPAHNLITLCNQHFITKKIWKINGIHYAKTLKSWLNNFDQNILRITNILNENKQIKNPKIMIQKWRIFFMACEELFKFNKGNEWYVTHNLLEKK